jgi:UDP-3-O-[3-hydroxymyristoyl] glucosamine N-acyltransferase
VSNNLYYQLLDIDNLHLDSKFKVVRKKEFRLTHYATSEIDGVICFVENEGYAVKASKNPNVAVVITTSKLSDLIADDKGLIISESPKKLFFEIHNSMSNIYTFENTVNEISDSAVIAETAIIGKGVKIGAGTRIGEYSIIEDGSVIGNHVLIENHVIIGGRGMHNTKIDGAFMRVTDLGNVVIEDDVEILSHAVIQKPYFYHSTRIGKESRISVGCNIGHGCDIGARCLIAGNSVIAGYCKLGTDVWVGPNSTMAHMIKVDDYSNILLGSVVIADIKKSQIVSGNFALDHAKNIKSYIRSKREK